MRIAAEVLVNIKNMSSLVTFYKFCPLITSKSDDIHVGKDLFTT